MTQREQINRLSADIDRIVDKYRAEFDLSYAAVIGILQLKVYLMCQETDEVGEDGGDSGGSDGNDGNDQNDQ